MAELFGAPYANLLRRQEGKPFSVGGRLVHPGDARGSPLMWMLYGRRLGAGYSPAPFDRPMVDVHPGPEPLDDEVLALFRAWIDLGAQFDDECAVGEWPRATTAPAIAQPVQSSDST